MLPLMYSDLVPWYRLIDPPGDHWDEAAAYQNALERGVSRPPETLLELGAGAGNNAFFLKRRFRCTLTDPSPEMQQLSIDLNPECEHLPGDMRSLRLGRTFDTVFVHDAVMYMTSEADLLAAATTAFLHTREGGAAVFAPDSVKEKFQEGSDMISGDDGRRSLRGIEWKWDPDPKDDTCMVEYAFLLREGLSVKAVHDRHLEGLFTTETWKRILTGVGYEVEFFERPTENEREVAEIFLCRRP